MTDSPRFAALLLAASALAAIVLAGAPSSAGSSANDVAIAVSAGSDHSCAVLESGKVECWGGNLQGALGDGTTTDRLTPVEVEGIDNAIDVSAGFGYTCALLRNRHAKCWGANDSGQLGDGSTTDRHTPVQVEGLDDVQAISSEDYGDETQLGTCALIAGGKVYCWGDISNGQLGDDSAELASEQTSTGGDDQSGDSPNQVSIHGEPAALTPAPVTGLDKVVSISDGDTSDRCAALETGEIQCWGSSYGSGFYEQDQQGDSGNGDSSGQSSSDPGQGGNGSDESAPKVEPTSTIIRGIDDAKQAAVGPYADGCALIGHGSVKCWNSEGKLTRIGSISDAVALAFGEDEFCALLSDGSASCWRDDYDGPKGVPAPVEGLSGATAIDGVVNYGGEPNESGPYDGHFCALVENAGVECWGDGLSGELGDGVPARHTAPVFVEKVEGAFSMGTGAGHACAAVGVPSSDGTSPAGRGAVCWGANQLGQLGDAKARHGYSKKRELDPLPATVVQLESVLSIGVGWWHACALSGDSVAGSGGEAAKITNGKVSCWGAGRRGQLGLGLYLYHRKSHWIMSRHPRPVRGLEDPIAISAGGNTSCALLASGGVDCWGGFVAPGPTAVPGITDAGSISVSDDGSYACALISGGRVECWWYTSPDDVDWGEGQGQLAEAPEPIPGISGATAVDASSACALIGGSVSCWLPDKPQAGVLQVDGISGATSIGDDCALQSDGGVACWQNLSEQRTDWENGDEGDDEDFKPVPPVAHQLEKIRNAISISADDNPDWDEDHYCALLESGKVACWGDNLHGELGNGELPFSDRPVGVLGLSISP